jgi:hypothetical protein
MGLVLDPGGLLVRGVLQLLIMFGLRMARSMRLALLDQGLAVGAGSHRVFQVLVWLGFRDQL